jgi:hypothetical protein
MASRSRGIAPIQDGGTATFAVMARAGTQERDGASAGEHLSGPWFREFHRAGDFIPGESLIAEVPGMDRCAVADDIKSPHEFTPQRGRYVCHRALRAGKPAPSLRVLLADAGQADLAPRFRRAANRDGREDPGKRTPANNRLPGRRLASRKLVLLAQADWQLRRNYVRMPKSRPDGEGTRRGYLGFITKRHQDRRIGHDGACRTRGLTSHDGLEWRPRNGFFRNFSQHMVMPGDRH